MKYLLLTSFLLLSLKGWSQYQTPEGFQDNARAKKQKVTTSTFPYKRFMLEGGGTFHFPDFPGGVSFFYGAGLTPQYLLSAWSDDGSFSLTSQTALGLMFISDINSNRSQFIFNFSLPLWADLRLGAGATSESKFPIGVSLFAGAEVFVVNQYTTTGPSFGIAGRLKLKERNLITLRLSTTRNLNPDNILRGVTTLSLMTGF
jgi:hypothetical protein